MAEIAGWIAPVATMIAAMMTAANLGARITGWGFVVFAVGSVAWGVVGFASGQQNLLLTNLFLLLVNVVGVWRWLGRQARYEDGGKAAARRSAHRPVPTLFAAGGLVGRTVKDRGGRTVGTVVDAMLRCEGRDIAYVVISDGAAAGETLRAVPPEELRFGEESLETRLDGAAIERLPPIKPDDWPAAAPRA